MGTAGRYVGVLGVALGISGCSQARDSPPQPSAAEIPRVLRAARVFASSEHGPNPGYTFVASNLVDGDLGTSWQPATSALASVQLDYDTEVIVSEIAVANGFQARDRYGDEFLLNRRVARGRLRFSDATEVPVQFTADARGYTRFAIDHKRTRSIELLVDDTFAGTKWNDLAISEIEVTGVASPAIAARLLESGPSPGSAALAAQDWWTPPVGERKSVEALAYGFAGIDDKDLGTVFTADLKPLYGVPKLFEDKPPRRVERDEMQKLVVKLRDSTQLDAGFRWLFFKAGTSYAQERDYQVIRAMQIHEVIRLDETARMRRPPEQAVFYLAEVHRGASYDLLVDGQRSAMGAQLELLFAQADGSARHVRDSRRYHLKAFGLGLRDVTNDGIFAMTPEQVAQRYRTGPAVPVQLVFRTIPGRDYQPTAYPLPAAVIDDPAFILQENESKAWTMPVGKYRLETTSDPNGITLVWGGAVACDRTVGPTTEYRELAITCSVAEPTELRITNPTTFGLGPSETVRLYVERL